jgi:chromosome segregation ATPase
MFKSKATLQSTLGKVNQFIEDLKSGIESHKQEVDSINEEISELYKTRDDLSNEIFQAIQLIGALSGTNN